MKLAQLACEPQLITIKIEDADTVKEFGEPLEFCMYDRQDMDSFMRMASLSEDDIAGITNLVSDLVLDDKGNKILVGTTSLPMNVMLKVVEAAVSSLGNSVSQTIQD
mgnify:CR=1 FL=1|jgi:hypothetical protein|tara:strand:- start:9424 stop:9744 length:321 start_codon:yes stop_codon:yes gene_type:complete